MNLLFDKATLLVVCFAFYVPNMGEGYGVVPLLAAILAGSLGSYFDHVAARVMLLLACVGYGLADGRFLFFLPLICFDLFENRWQSLAFLVLLPLGIHGRDLGLVLVIQIVLMILLAWLLKNRSNSLQRLKQDSMVLRDANQETALQLEKKERELLDKQDYEVNMATLHERNRIAREIHDNVGHQLTRAILLTGAMCASCPDEAIRKNLDSLQQTLRQSMDSIRDSLHDLHDQSVDLQTELATLLKAFTFCPVKLDYDVEHGPDKKSKYAFLAIVREALSNIARHSGATAAEIILREHPGFYQLVVRDNGRGEVNVALAGEKGIGLGSIAERVKSLDGLLNIKGDKGFVIFITIPKAQQKETPA